MQLLPQDPKKRKMFFLAAGAGVILVAGAFLFVMYGMPAAIPEAQQTVAVVGGNASEGSFKIIEGNIGVLRGELQNDFYKSLKRYKWTTDAATPGKQNPFSDQRVGSSE